jgi:hypothetical protein
MTVLLHLAGLLLNLLQHYGAKEVRMVSVGWLGQHSFGHAYEVIP